jgi:hypothetical protein
VVICPVCGEAFDEYRYQVRAPGLLATFDSVDCAARAIAVATSAARLAAAKDGAARSDTPALAAPGADGYRPLARYSP